MSIENANKREEPSSANLIASPQTSSLESRELCSNCHKMGFCQLSTTLKSTSQFEEGPNKASAINSVLENAGWKRCPQRNIRNNY